MDGTSTAGSLMARWHRFIQRGHVGHPHLLSTSSLLMGKLRRLIMYLLPGPLQVFDLLPFCFQIGREPERLLVGWVQR
jgi:hypothetical protein